MKNINQFICLYLNKLLIKTEEEGMIGFRNCYIDEIEK